ncbi:MAG: phosphoglycerate dehydrogenase [Chloroflexota bacterium]|nr:phosphoglycerate dehydrogenase [Chloroflexota bacterium]
MRDRVLIADKLAPEGIAHLEPHVEVVFDPSISAETLTAAIPGFDGLIVRSRTRVSSEVIQAGGRLQVIGRAGVGVDNIDVAAATQAGVTVVNAPTGNAVAAAEHAVTVLLALARNVPQADQSVRSGQWQRTRFMGVEVHDKRLGLLGLGRIASLVATRAQAFGMEVVAFDPYVGEEYAARLGVELLPFEELVASADFISIHIPLTEQTKNLLGATEFGRCKPTVRIVNCARGGIVDEAALLEALDADRVAGAALDVFSMEPPVDNPLLDHAKVVLTPHIAGSTHEAQQQVAVDVADQVLAVLQGKPAMHAINMPIIPPKDLEILIPFVDLVERMGHLLTQFEPGVLGSMELTVHGPIANFDSSYLQAAALKGLLDNVVTERINLVNARHIARQRGLILSERRQRHHEERYENMLTLAVTNGDRSSMVRGSVLQGVPHIVAIDDLWVDFEARGHFLLTWHYDRPGIIGRIGTILGENDINIAFMHVGRRSPRGEAIMVLGLDDPIPEALFPQILAMPHNYWVKALEL